MTAFTRAHGYFRREVDLAWRLWQDDPHLQPVFRAAVLAYDDFWRRSQQPVPAAKAPELTPLALMDRCVNCSRMFRRRYWHGQIVQTCQTACNAQLKARARRKSA